MENENITAKEIFNNDRVHKYFEKYLKTFLFVEFSDEFMDKLGIKDIAGGIRVPIKPQDLKNFAGGDGISAVNIAENMIVVIGCNPNFQYAENYKKYIEKFFDQNLIQDMMMVGIKAVQNGDLDNACIHFRTCIYFAPTMLEAMYNYARVCREMYLGENIDDEQYIGDFKAESLVIFEQLSIMYPEFDESYYFLGYAYLNMGLYEKAALAWESYIELTENVEGIREIKDRLVQLAEPREIENGCNDVIAGRYQSGFNKLIRFMGSNYNTWWPLHFYIATACEELGNVEMAISEYKETLKLNAGSVDAINGLIRLYTAKGDGEMIEKYTKKKEIVVKMFSEK